LNVFGNKTQHFSV